MAKGAGNLHLKFTSDIEKASRDIDKLIVKVERLSAVAKEQKAKIAASTAPSIPMTDYGQQWGKSFGSFGMGGMTHLGGSPFGPNPRAMVEARATEKVAQKMSIFSRIMGGINEKTMRFMGSMGVVNPQIGMMATKFGLLGAVIVGLIGIVKHVVGQVAHFGNIIEQSRIVIKSIYGSDRKAVETIRGMREFSRKTQFEPEEVVGATTMMAKYNLDPFKKGEFGLAKDKHVMDLMAGLASMPGMGGKPIGLDRAVNAVIAGRDVRPIKALGPEAIAAYEKAKGSGMSGSPEFIKTMVTELAKVPKIMALANEQADSMKGLWSTITGYAEEFWMDLSGAGEETGVVTLWSQLKDILRDVRDGGERFLKYIGPYVTELGAYLGAVLKYVWNLLGLIWQIVSPVLIPVFKIMIQLFRIIWEVGKALTNTFIQLGKILVAIVMIPVRIISLLTGADIKIKDVIAGLMKLVLGLQITFMFTQIYLDALVDKMIYGIDRLMNKFEELANKYPNLVRLINGLGTFGVSEVGRGGVIQVDAETQRKAMKASPRYWLNKVAPETFDPVPESTRKGAPSTINKREPLVIDSRTYNFYETKKNDIENQTNLSGKIPPLLKRPK